MFCGRLPVEPTIMRPPALDLPYCPTPKLAQLALRQTAREQRYFGHLWVWMAASAFLVGIDLVHGFSDLAGVVISCVWGGAVWLHHWRVWRVGRRRFLQQHGALLEVAETSDERGVLALRDRLLRGLDGARDCLSTSGQDTLASLANGERQALAMVAWLIDAEPLLATQRSTRRERRRVMAELARPGPAVDRQLCQELLTLLDDNDRRSQRIESQAERQRERVESFLLAVDSAQIVRLSKHDATDHGGDEETSLQRRVGLLEQVLDRPVLEVGVGPSAMAPSGGGPQAEVVKETARFRQEVALARQLQLSILPSAAPRLRGLEVAHLYRPSSELGGDFYDFYALPASPAEATRLLVALGDASGHGLDSSMVSSMAKSALYMQVAAQKDLAAAMVELNRMMCDTLGRRRMMTLVLLEIEIGDGQLRWTNAGQLYPLLCRGRQIIELTQPGYPLGVRRQQGFAVARQQLLPGDQLVMLTDGFIEADNGQDIYGWPRLLEVLEQRPRGGAHQLIEHLVADLASHLGETDTQDDVTLVALDYRHGTS